jgi:hypothetical protein
MRTFNLHNQKPIKQMETLITPWPTEIPHKLPFGTFARAKREIANVGRSTATGHIAYYIHPSDNGGRELREIVTLHHGKKYVHRYQGDTRRAMDMILAVLQWGERE